MNASRELLTGDLLRVLDRLDPALVLVDCFGTLLHRTAPSGRARELAAHDLSVRIGCCTAEEILGARKRAEGEPSLSDTPDGDYRLPALASALHRLLPVRHVSLDDFVTLVCDCELAAEQSISVPNQALAEALADLADDRSIVILTDTNLTSRMVKDLLTRHGLGGLATEVITSSDAGATKRAGRLYEHVLARHGVAPERTVMIGDRPDVDGRMAEQAGMRSILVPPGPWDTVKRADRRTLERSAERAVSEVLSGGDDDVLPEMALTLWLFTRRLDSALRRQSARRAVFLAREGEFLKALFDLAQQAMEGRGLEPIMTSYLRTSRRSTLLAAATDPARWLRSLPSGVGGLTWSSVVDLLRPEGTSAVPGDPNQPLTAEGIDQMASSSTWLELVAARSEETRAAIRSLVVRADPAPGDLHTVDVGWKGTVRDNLATALPRRTVWGHLLGFVGGAADPAAELKRGHLFADGPRRTPWFPLFSHFKGLFELVLAAGHGSVARYVVGPTGTVTVEHEAHPPEERCHRELIAPFQAACLVRYAELERVLAPFRDEPAWLTDVVARHHARMMFRPTAAELQFVDALVQVDGLGPGTVLRAGGGPSTGRRSSWPRRHVGGGGWPPLRMRRAGADWERPLYGAYKMAQMRRRKLR